MPQMLLLPGKVTSQFSTIGLQDSSPEADFLLNFSHLLLGKVVDPASRQQIVFHEEFEEQEEEDEDRQCQGDQATSHRQSQVLLICWLFFNFNFFKLLISSVYFNISSASCSSTFHQQGFLQVLIGKQGISKLLSLLLLINLSSSLNGKHDCSERPQNCTSLEELQKLMKIVKSLLDVCLSSINTGVSNTCLSLHFKRSNQMLNTEVSE